MDFERTTWLKTKQSTFFSQKLLFLWIPLWVSFLSWSRVQTPPGESRRPSWRPRQPQGLRGRSWFHSLSFNSRCDITRDFLFRYHERCYFAKQVCILKAVSLHRLVGKREGERKRELSNHALLPETRKAICMSNAKDQILERSDFARK